MSCCSEVFGHAHLRRVNGSNHSKLAMSDLSAVEPDRLRVVDGQSEDGFLER